MLPPSSSSRRPSGSVAATLRKELTRARKARNPVRLIFFLLLVVSLIILLYPKRPRLSHDTIEDSDDEMPLASSKELPPLPDDPLDFLEESASLVRTFSLLSP